MIREEINNVRLKISLDGGLDGDKQVIKSKTYNRIKANATGDGLYAVGTALADLQVPSVPAALPRSRSNAALLYCHRHYTSSDCAGKRGAPRRLLPPRSAHW